MEVYKKNDNGNYVFTNKDGTVFEFEKTSSACPEQYDIYKIDENGDKSQIGYFRLRHGFFRFDYLDCGGETVYDGYPQGDGCFREERDRVRELRKGLYALIKYQKERLREIQGYGQY